MLHPRTEHLSDISLHGWWISINIPAINLFSFFHYRDIPSSALNLSFFVTGINLCTEAVDITIVSTFSPVTPTFEMQYHYSLSSYPSDDSTRTIRYVRYIYVQKFKNINKIARNNAVNFEAFSKYDVHLRQ